MQMTDIVVPVLGESIVEGTVGKWHKSVGDRVTADETLVEIETDKVTAEVPAPASGTLVEILVQSGASVAPGTVIARVSGEGQLTAEPREP